MTIDAVNLSHIDLNLLVHLASADWSVRGPRPKKRVIVKRQG
jgi:hypothetical protein